MLSTSAVGDPNILAQVMQTPSAVERMIWLLRLRILIPAISVAARLGIADQIADQPISAAIIAAKAGAHPAATYRLLRCLASAGIFVEGEGEIFGHTALSRTLRAGEAGEIGDFAKMYTAEWMVRALDGLEHSVRTGEGCLAKALGKPGYEWIGERPDEAALVDRAMSAYSRTIESGLAEALDVAGARHIVDVGGGDGAFLIQLLSKHRTMRGTVAELARVVARARTQIEAKALTDRCDVVEADMFNAVPAGADMYLLKRVLHNWTDEKAVTVLDRIREAAGARGTVAIIDSMIPASGRGLFSTLGDLQELGLGGARERTEGEFRALCSAAKLHVRRIDFPTEYTAIIYAGR